MSKPSVSQMKICRLGIYKTLALFFLISMTGHFSLSQSHEYELVVKTAQTDKIDPSYFLEFLIKEGIVPKKQVSEFYIQVKEQIISDLVRISTLRDEEGLTQAEKEKQQKSLKIKYANLYVLHEIEWKFNKIKIKKKGSDNDLEKGPGSGFPPSPLGPGDPCTNMDFEQCNYTGWDLYDGDVDANPFGYVSVVSTVPGTQHTIMTGGIDPVVGIPMVNPSGGTCSARLGDGTGSGGRAASLEQTFLVSAANAVFTYSYALVLQDPSSHTLGEKPFFKINMYDASGNTIPCGNYSVVAGSGGDPDFVPYSGGFYLPWRTTFAPLVAYIGQNVTIEFIIGDCDLGGHYGYGYIDASCMPLEIITSSPAICGGNAITLTAPSGAATYNWSTGATTQTISTATPGTYDVTVTPVTGSACAITMSITIPGTPDFPTAQFSATDVCIAAPNIFTESSFVSGTDAIVSWSWDFGDGTGTSTLQNPTYTYAAIGTYPVTLTVTTSFGCTHDTTLNVNVFADLSLSLAAVDVTCFGACNGNAIITPSNGTSPFTYLWTPAVSTAQNAANLCTGNYTVSITDNNGCIGDTSFSIIEPSGFVLTTSSINANCNQADGSASVDNTSGATSPYTYAWTSGGTGTLEQPLIPGNYTVTITDQNACDTAVTINVGNNPPPTATATAIATLCYSSCDGTATVTPSGGTTPGIFTYLWSDGQGTQTATSLCASSYSVTVEDGNGCQAFVTTNVTQPTPVAVSAAPLSTTICIGGTASISAVASGGTPSYTYQWSSGWTSSGPNSVTLTQDSCFTVTVTDANGCVSPPAQSCVLVYPPVIANAFPDQTICEGDTVSMSGSATGGNSGPYTFTWYDAAFAQVGTGQYLTTSPQGSKPDTVTYAIITSDGCSPDDTAYVNIDFYDQPQPTFLPDTFSGCEPLPVTFFNTTASTAQSCLWNVDGDFISDCDSFIFVFDGPGTYSVDLTIISLDGCEETSSPGQIIVYENPEADFTFTPQPTNIHDMYIYFFDNSYGNINIWNWSFYDNEDNDELLSSIVEQNPEYDFATSYPANAYIYFLKDTGEYPVNLEVTTINGCVHDTTLYVIIDGVFYENIANAFTPNEDGLNDYFFPKGIGINPEDGYLFQIYNRWGDLIFESEDLDNPWDGTANGLGGKAAAQQGVYVWRLEFKDITRNHRKHGPFVGHVTLLK